MVVSMEFTQRRRHFSRKAGFLNGSNYGNQVKYSLLDTVYLSKSDVQTFE